MTGESKEIMAYGEKVLVRHAGHVEPDVYNIVHRLIEGPVISTLKMLSTTRPLATQVGINPVLNNNCEAPKESFLQDMVALLNWCTELKEAHCKLKMRELIAYEPNRDRKGLPESIYKPNYTIDNKPIT